MDAFQVKWPRWRQLTSTAAHRGVLCFGPNKGRNVTYTNPHRWSPGLQPAGGAEAVATLVRRYLQAFGPASTDHFARWLNIPPRAARAAFEEMGDELEPVEVDGEPPGSWPATRRSRRDRPRAPAPPLLRCLRGRRAAPRTPVPGRGGEARAVAIGPGRQLPGPADRWRRRRRLAPAAVGQAGRDHRRAVATSLGVTTARARGGGGDRRRGARRRAGADDRDGHGRRARLSVDASHPNPDGEPPPNGLRWYARMKAVVQDRYGPPDVLRIEEIERPLPRADEVLIRIRAARSSQSDGHARAASRSLAALPRTPAAAAADPRRRACGRGRRRRRRGDEFKVGEAVFGSPARYFGSARRVRLRARARAAGAEAGRLELRGCRRGLPTARCRRCRRCAWPRAGPGSRIVIYGASGSLGTAAVQLGKHFGAHVTGGLQLQATSSWCDRSARTTSSTTSRRTSPGEGRRTTRSSTRSGSIPSGAGDGR